MSSAAPTRNFSLSVGERIQAIVTGLPAWARRLKRIEDLRALLAKRHQEGAKRAELEALFAELDGLVVAHNAYYPIEANLPFDAATSRLVDRGKPWRPMRRATLDEILRG